METEASGQKDGDGARDSDLGGGLVVMREETMKDGP